MNYGITRIDDVFNQITEQFRYICYMDNGIIAKRSVHNEFGNPGAHSTTKSTLEDVCLTSKTFYELLK